MPEYAGLFRKMPVNASGMDFTHKCRHFLNPVHHNTITIPQISWIVNEFRLNIGLDVCQKHNLQCLEF